MSLIPNGRSVALETVDIEGDAGCGTGICTGLGVAPRWRLDTLCGRMDTDDELGDDSGEDGSELDHDGDLGTVAGYDSDSMRLQSSEWCDERKDSVSENVSGVAPRRRGGLT